jgi:hypothetical protein
MAIVTVVLAFFTDIIRSEFDEGTMRSSSLLAGVFQTAVAKDG